jgi:ABC-type oligopeptide transport system substrate-binding subunit
MKERGIRLNRDVQANIYYFAFNMNDPVVGSPPNLSAEQREKNRKLRQAISLSIDAQAYIDLFSQGIGKPAEFIVPPGVFRLRPETTKIRIAGTSRI